MPGHVKSNGQDESPRCLSDPPYTETAIIHDLLQSQTSRWYSNHLGQHISVKVRERTSLSQKTKEDKDPRLLEK